MNDEEERTETSNHSDSDSDPGQWIGPRESIEAFAFEQKYVLPPSSKARGVNCPTYPPESEANDWLGFEEHVEKFAGDLAWT